MRSAKVRIALLCLVMCSCAHFNSNLLAVSLTGASTGEGNADREVVLSSVTSAGVAVVDDEDEGDDGPR